MNRLTVKSRVGADGILNVAVRLGPAEANCEVNVTIEPANGRTTTPGDYGAWLESLSGRWQGDFERPPLGVLEEREPLY